MPIYEYICKSCKNEFEALILGKEQAVCSACGGKELERVFSLPAVKSETTAGLAKRAAQKRDKAQANEKMHEQLKYEQSHDRHG
ncbi:MAG: FmdB family zinc ribbon protein [Longimicrobiales bacterium]